MHNEQFINYITKLIINIPLVTNELQAVHAPGTFGRTLLGDRLAFSFTFTKLSIMSSIPEIHSTTPHPCGNVGRACDKQIVSFLKLVPLK